MLAGKPSCYPDGPGFWARGRALLSDGGRRESVKAAILVISRVVLTVELVVLALAVDVDDQLDTPTREEHVQVLSRAHLGHVVRGVALCAILVHEPAPHSTVLDSCDVREYFTGIAFSLHVAAPNCTDLQWGVCT